MRTRCGPFICSSSRPSRAMGSAQHSLRRATSTAASFRHVEQVSPLPTRRTANRGASATARAARAAPEYLVAVRLFEASALEMLRMYEDGDEERLAKPCHSAWTAPSASDD